MFLKHPERIIFTNLYIQVQLMPTQVPKFLLKLRTDKLNPWICFQPEWPEHEVDFSKGLPILKPLKNLTLSLMDTWPERL